MQSTNRILSFFFSAIFRRTFELRTKIKSTICEFRNQEIPSIFPASFFFTVNQSFLLQPSSTMKRTSSFYNEKPAVKKPRSDEEEKNTLTPAPKDAVYYQKCVYDSHGKLISLFLSHKPFSISGDDGAAFHTKKKTREFQKLFSSTNAFETFDFETCIRLLDDKEVDPNAPNPIGETPLSRVIQVSGVWLFFLCLCPF